MIKNIFPLLLFILLSCKKNDIVIDENNSVDKSITNNTITNNRINSDVSVGEIDQKTKFDLITVKQISNNAPVDSILKKLNQMKVEMLENKIFINNHEAKFDIEKDKSNAFFGKKYLYNFYVNLLSNDYKVDIKNEVSYLQLSYEDSNKYPFKDYFMEGGVCVYKNDYLLLEYSDYIIVFKKKSTGEISSKSTSDSNFFNTLNVLNVPLVYSYGFITELKNFKPVPNNLTSVFKIDNYDGFKAIKLKGNNVSIDLVLVSCSSEEGQSILKLCSMSNGKLIESLLIFNSEESENGVISTTYEISKEYKVKIKKCLIVDKKGGGVTEKDITYTSFEIENSGKFKKV